MAHWSKACRNKVEPAVGIEPTTRSLQNSCSTTELSWQITRFYGGVLLVFGVESALVVWEKQRKVMESPFISELLSVWLLDKIENTFKPLRPRSKQAIRVMANAFKAEFKDARIKEIDQTRIERYLLQKGIEN